MVPTASEVSTIMVYAFNLLLPPAIGWAIWMFWTMKKIAEMLENPDRTGFGTDGFQEVIERNTTAINGVTSAMEALVHYVKWLSEHTTGTKPPPPLVKPDHSRDFD